MNNKQNVGSLNEKVYAIKKACKKLCKSETIAAESQYIIGNNLREIKEGGLFKDGNFNKFEEFCQKRFGFTKQYAYMLINASIVQKQLEEKGVLKIKCPEKILRMLTAKKYQEEQIQKEIWIKATQNNPKRIPRRKEIINAQKEVLPPVVNNNNNKSYVKVINVIKPLLDEESISNDIKELLEMLNEHLSNALKEINHK